MRRLIESNIMRVYWNIHFILHIYVMRLDMFVYWRICVCVCVCAVIIWLVHVSNEQSTRHSMWTWINEKAKRGHLTFCNGISWIRPVKSDEFLPPHQTNHITLFYLTSHLPFGWEKETKYKFESFLPSSLFAIAQTFECDRSDFSGWKSKKTWAMFLDEAQLNILEQIRIDLVAASHFICGWFIV